MFTENLIRSVSNLHKINRKIFKQIPIVSLSSSRSQNESTSTLKQLINSKRYAEVIQIYNEKPNLRTNSNSILALRACITLKDYQSGIRIHQQLSPESCQDPLIQTSLIHFYSEINRNLLMKSSSPLRNSSAMW